MRGGGGSSEKRRRGEGEGEGGGGGESPKVGTIILDYRQGIVKSESKKRNRRGNRASSLLREHGWVPLSGSGKWVGFWRVWVCMDVGVSSM